MRRQSPQSCDSRLQIIERQIAFPTHPFDPPSSPPPTSPLPPLPEIALNSNHGSPVSTISPIYSIPTGRPIRPPRPQTSLPNLKPRIITSPEVSERQRHSTGPAQARISPTPLSRRRKDPRTSYRSPKSSALHETVTAYNTGNGSTPRYSDDSLGALPKLLNKLSSPRLIHNEVVRHCALSGTIDLWRNSLARNAEGSSQTNNRRKQTRKAVARSALFIPRTPPKEVSRVNAAEVQDPMKAGRQSDVLQEKRTGASMQEVSRHGPSPFLRQDCSSRKYHKRSHAVTSFAFNFDVSEGSNSPSASEENLTSLPRIPSDPILFVTSVMGKKDVTKRSLPIFSSARNESDEAITFAVLPYAHTLQSAGPRPKMGRDNKVRFDVDCDIETGEEEVRQLSEEEMRTESRKRILWAIATVILVVVATAGILIGIVWKLQSLT